MQAPFPCHVPTGRKQSKQEVSRRHPLRMDTRNFLSLCASYTCTRATQHSLLCCGGTAATMASQSEGPPDQANHHEAEVIVDADMDDQSHAEGLRQPKRQRT